MGSSFQSHEDMHVGFWDCEFQFPLIVYPSGNLGTTTNILFTNRICFINVVEQKMMITEMACFYRNTAVNI